MTFSIVGDFVIKNETIESKYSFYYWPKPHRLHYKINNQDDLLSFAQIDIIDNDVRRLNKRLNILLIIDSICGLGTT